jgi:hypothetical protein
MSKAELVAKLKADQNENKFSLDGEYIVFDKTSNLKYQPYGYGLTLGDLLTANPVSNTRLNVALLLTLSGVQVDETFKDLRVLASYRSPEYDLLNFGQSDSKLYTKGDALALGTKDVDGLLAAVKTNFTPGEIGVYKWGVHIGRTKEPKEWDKRSDTSIKQKALDFLINDKMKNILLIGVAAAAGWFFFLRKKS